MIGLAVPAYADDTDDAFLASLNSAGFTYSDAGQAIRAAHYVCRQPVMARPSRISHGDPKGEPRTECR